jgi:hypothetical protein
MRRTSGTSRVDIAADHFVANIPDLTNQTSFRINFDVSPEYPGGQT